MPQLSSLVAALPASGIRKIFDRADELQRAGREVIRFDVGQPSLSPPAFALEAAHRALETGKVRYTPNRGLPALVEALRGWLSTTSGVSYAEGEVIVTAGASEAVAACMFAVLEPGSEVVIPEPSWPHYAACARLVGATPVSVSPSLEQGLVPSIEDIERAITPNTRLIVVNSPSNPTGVVFPRATQEAILELARKRDLLVLADEIYQELYFTGERPTSFASLPGARERTILVGGFSKAFCMTGLRVGFMAAPRELADHLNKPHQYIAVCANAPGQLMAAAACAHPETSAYLAQARAHFRGLRDAFLEELGDGLRYVKPEGAFYLYPALPDGVSDMQAAQALVEEAGVAAVPGSVFGDAYTGFLRLSFGSCSVEQVRLGAQRILACCGSLT